jgi:hypothetical protein
VRTSPTGDWGPSLTFTVPNGGDATPPALAITSPFGNVGVSVGTIALAGTASDNVGVAQVTWSNDRGGSGVATGTTAWSVASVPLQVGTNVLTVTARDAAGNARQASVTVAYVPPTTTSMMPVPMSPAGSSATGTPTFTWSAVPGATTYHLWANDGVANGRIQYSVSATQAGCASGTGTCSASPGVTVTGRVQWWVRVAAPSGGDWSIGLTFQAP